MLAKIYSAILDGLKGKIIEVEAGLMNGLNSFSIIGLTDRAIQEAKERINLALKSINAKPPIKFNKRIVINLAPANIKKEGSLLDLAITLSFLIASQQLKKPEKKILFLGELSLGGKLRRIKSILPIVLSLKDKFDEIYLPEENLNEVKYLECNHIYLFKDLNEVINHLEGIKLKEVLKPEKIEKNYYDDDIDLTFIKFSPYILRTILISASGRHNLILSGPPGTGKTLIAKNLVKLLPRLDYQEAIEVSSIYNAAGYELDNLILQPPFRNPHHSSSLVSIIGGGQNLKTGEITLAHRGVLFFDEMPEFRRDILEALREPLENGEITISRAMGSVKFPAKFLFIGAYNPCPCGFYNDPQKECKCTSAEINRYQKKLSGPILDRIDLQINVPRLKTEEIFNNEEWNFKELREKVTELKKKQLLKQNKYNSELTPKEIKFYCRLDYSAEKLLFQAIDRFHLSHRAIHKIIKISKTIADLEDKDIINQEHIAEALQYRLTDFHND